MLLPRGVRMLLVVVVRFEAAEKRWQLYDYRETLAPVVLAAHRLRTERHAPRTVGEPAPDSLAS